MPCDAVRRQPDNETIPEFESALRALHREAWPDATPEQRDSDLKKVPHPTVGAHLQVHAPNADFPTTVLKACTYIEAHENTRPNKSVRIITQPPDHTTLADSEENPSFVQPLLQGFRDVLKEHFPPASVKQINRDPSPGDTNKSPQYQIKW